jgi:hypothetical protein
MKGGKNMTENIFEDKPFGAITVEPWINGVYLVQGDQRISMTREQFKKLMGCMIDCYSSQLVIDEDKRKYVGLGALFG